MKPMFSIIIPSHNGESCLARCLDSVEMQHYRNYETVVICDACTDRTEDIAKKFGVKTFTVDYHRDGLTRNVGLDHAEGEFILFLDHDDWWMHEYVLDLLCEQISENPALDCLYFSFVWKGMGYYRQTPNRSYIAVWNKMWRREFIGKTRFTDRPHWSDTDFNEQMKLKPGKRVYWDHPVYYYNYLYPGSINAQYAAGEIE